MRIRFLNEFVGYYMTASLHLHAIGRTEELVDHYIDGDQ